MKFPLPGFEPPEEADNPYEGLLQEFVSGVSSPIRKFYEEHPNAIILGTEVEKDADGEYKLIINAIEPTE